MRQLFTRYGWLIAIVAAYLYVFPYFPRIHSANELPRVYLVKAIVHDGTFAIDRGVARWGATADVSPYKGHLYSNKAPGSSLLAVPVYAVVSWIAGEPSLGASLWICRVVTGVIPMALFLWLLWGFLERFTPYPSIRRLAVLAYAFGSMAMTYSLLYFSHQLAAICIASAWILALDFVDGKRGLGAMIAAGALAGCAPLVDYQAAFAGVPIAIHIAARMWRWPPRQIARVVAVTVGAAAIPIGVLLAYHAECFGSPFRTGYDTSQTFAHFHQQGFLGVTELRWEAFYGSMFRPDNGLFTLAPWLLLAVPGCELLWRRDPGVARTCAAIAVLYILFVSSINFWRGGWGVGPRYITAMLPFLVPLVVAALDRARSRPLLAGAACGLIVAGVIVYAGSSATFPYWPDSLANPLYEVTMRLFADGAFPTNAGESIGLSGFAAIAPFVLGVAALVGHSIYRAFGGRALVLAIVVGSVLIAAYSQFPATKHHGDAAYRNTVYPAVIDR